MKEKINQLTEEAVALLQRMISIPSVSREEHQVADLLYRYCEEHALCPNRSGNNIWCIASDYDAARPTLLLNAHIDTVKATSAWTHNPFTPTIEGDCLYGLGSNDDGASVVSLLQVFRTIITVSRPYNLIYLASCEEEVSGKNGIESVLSLLPPVHVALVGEPTGMQPAIAEKGLMVLDVTAYGKAGHAARNEGDNAIYKVLDDIRWFRDYRFEKESPLLGAVKMSVTMVQAGTQHNVVPDKCTFVVDVRSNECYTNAELYDLICSHICCEAKARSFRLNSSSIELNHPLVQRALSLGCKPFGSPTLSDQALLPFPSLKMGPGDSARSHTADEYIKVSEICRAIEFYLQLLNGLEI